MHKTTLVAFDDSSSDLEALRFFAQEQGILIISCSTPQQVLDFFEATQNTIDGLICDLSMPGVDAIKFVKSFKEKYKNKFVFGLTGMDANSPLFKEAKESGYFYRVVAKTTTFPQIILDDILKIFLLEIKTDVKEIISTCKDLKG